MSKFSIFTDYEIEEIRQGPNCRGGWRVYFPSNFVKKHGEYIHSINVSGVKLTKAVDGRLLVGNEYDRKFFMFIRTKSGVDLKNKTVIVEIAGRDFQIEKIKFKVTETGPRGLQYDYALMDRQK